MELNLTHDNICINETVYDGQLEQSIELDAMLPDYCPSVFKVLSCTMDPKVTSCRNSADKVLIDATAHIRILYVSEENNQIRCSEHKVPFSKTIDLKEPLADPYIKVSVRADYLNCRVVNPKRLDIRGAATISVKITSQRCEDIICDASGGGLQLRKEMMEVGCPVRSTMKQFSMEEELELSYGKPPMAEILNTTCTPMVTDYKIIANKVIVKGELLLHILYLPDGDSQKPEVMEHSVPVSQIVDLDGVDEDYLCWIKLEVCSLEIQTGGAQESDGKTFSAEFILNASVNAYRSKEISVVSDVYSTQFESQAQCKSLKSERMLAPFAEPCMCKDSIDLPEGAGGVYDVWCLPGDVSCEMGIGEMTFSGMVTAYLLTQDGEGMPLLLQKTVEFSHKMELKDRGSELAAEAFIQVISTNCSLTGSGAEVRAELKISGCLYQRCERPMVVQVSLDEEQKQDKTDLPALTIYYPDQGESIWEIAKRYRTSVEAIMEENSLESDEINERGMLLIPIVD